LSGLLCTLAAVARPHLCVAQENRLLRDTPFLCDFHFRNDLPLPPVGPKLLPVQVDRARITAYQPVGLLWDKPSDAPLEYELAMAVDPLDAERYRVQPGGPPVLDPEDEALLVPEPGTGGAGGRTAKKAKMDNNAGWLMRTLYLSDAQLPKASSADENVHARALKERQLTADGVFLSVPAGGDPKDAQVAAIEESFSAMEEPPVHPSKPELRPVEVLPILPDFVRWPEMFSTVSFDHDPLSELGYTAKSQQMREAAAKGAFMKSFATFALEPDNPDEPPPPPERFLVYFAPTEATAAGGDAAAGGAGGGSHEWVREYTYRTPETGDTQTLVLYLGEGSANYVLLNKRFDLRRRVVRGAGGEAQLPRPSHVSLVARDRTPEEEEAAAELVYALTNPAIERPPTPMEEDDAAVGAADQIGRDIFGDSDDDD
jgi:RNA polymerase II-associated factor 1